MALEEPLLIEDVNRKTIFPIKYTDIWQMYETHENAFWKISEVSVIDDKRQFDSLDKNERHFIKHILAFFVTGDVVVNQNLSQRFLQEIKIEEARQFYGFQYMMENVHSQMYSRLLETYLADSVEIEYLRNSVTSIPCIKRKADWAKKWIESETATLAERIFAFACFEGIFFSGSFCAIFRLSSKNLLNGLCKSNEFINRDEGLHTMFACLLYNKYIVNKLTPERMYEILIEAVNIETEFITDALPCSLIGINAELMTQYIQYIANRLLKCLKYEPYYKVENQEVKQPFDFMDRILLEVKDNFFEQKSTRYSREEDNEVIDKDEL